MSDIENQKYYDDRGFLTEHGKSSFNELGKEIKLRLDSADNESELRFLGGLIAALVGDLVAGEVINRRFSKA